MHIDIKDWTSSHGGIDVATEDRRVILNVTESELGTTPARIAMSMPEARTLFNNLVTAIAAVDYQDAIRDAVRTQYHWRSDGDPAGHESYCIHPTHYSGEWCDAGPREEGSGPAGTVPSEAWKADHPRATFAQAPDHAPEEGNGGAAYRVLVKGVTIGSVRSDWNRTHGVHWRARRWPDGKALVDSSGVVRTFESRKDAAEALRREARR